METEVVGVFYCYSKVTRVSLLKGNRLLSQLRETKQRYVLLIIQSTMRISELDVLIPRLRPCCYSR